MKWSWRWSGQWSVVSGGGGQAVQSSLCSSHSSPFISIGRLPSNTLVSSVHPLFPLHHLYSSQSALNSLIHQHTHPSHPRDHHCDILNHQKDKEKNLLHAPACTRYLSSDTAPSTHPSIHVVKSTPHSHIHHERYQDHASGQTAHDPLPRKAHHSILYVLTPSILSYTHI